MKEQDNKKKINFFKKIFIKICRIFGYEIIDQSNFYVPTQEKFLSENLNIQGEKSISVSRIFKIRGGQGGSKKATYGK